MRATPGTRKPIEPLGVDPERPDRHRDHAACVRRAARAAVRNREPAAFSGWSTRQSRIGKYNDSPLFVGGDLRAAGYIPRAKPYRYLPRMAPHQIAGRIEARRFDALDDALKAASSTRCWNRTTKGAGWTNARCSSGLGAICRCGESIAATTETDALSLIRRSCRSLTFCTLAMDFRTGHCPALKVPDESVECSQ